MRAYLCLLIAISSSVLMLGCEEEKEELIPLVPPKVVNTNPKEGDKIRGNASIIATFSKKMKFAEISVSGAEGVTTLKDATAVWMPSQPMSPGTYTLMITGADMSGQELVGFEPITFEVGFDTEPHPGIDNDKSDPKDGAIDVDPESYSEKLVVSFNEPVSEVKVVKTDPEFPFTTELIYGWMTLEIRFQGYNMPNNTKFTIVLDATDMAGNKTTLVYSFTTI
jgi:hypothetical protein